MDYKAKYDQALERAKRWADGTLQPDRTTPQGVCEAIFPELRESEDEDEIIRKWLIEECQKVIDIANPAYDTSKAKKAIAWLEKQKDSIPYEKYVYDIAAINAEAKTKYHAGWNDGYEAKQKEQKPADLTYTDAIEACMLRYLQSAANRKDDDEIMEDTRKYKQELLDLIQKPTEWSEEDEKCLQELMQHIEHCVTVYGAEQPKWQRWLNLLKFLRPQPKWKPAEAQMNELHGALIPGHGYDCDVLQGLYADLKKQMKEDWQ